MTPLWMPKGSVRALLALGIVFAAIASGLLWAAGVPAAEKAFAGLGPLAGYVLKDYFVERRKS